MTCNCQGYCSCGCESEQPINVIEQAVNDALAGRIDELNGYSDSAKDSADAAKVSEINAEGYAEESKGFRDQTEIIYQNAQALVPEILEASQNVEDAANAVNEAINTASSITVKRYYYTIQGGETTITIPEDLAPRSVQYISIEGFQQWPGNGFNYDANTRVVTMDDAFDSEQAGRVAVLVLGTINVDSPETFPSTLASSQGATMVGTTSGETVQAELNNIEANLSAKSNEIANLNTALDLLAVSSSYIFNTFSAMQSSAQLKAGNLCYTVSNNQGAVCNALWAIATTADTTTYSLNLASGLYANLRPRAYEEYASFGFGSTTDAAVNLAATNEAHRVANLKSHMSGLSLPAGSFPILTTELNVARRGFMFTGKGFDITVLNYVGEALLDSVVLTLNDTTAILTRQHYYQTISNFTVNGGMEQDKYASSVAINGHYAQVYIKSYGHFYANVDLNGLSGFAFIHSQGRSSPTNTSYATRVGVSINYNAWDVKGYLSNGITGRTTVQLKAFTTTLAAAATIGDTTLTVADASGLRRHYILELDPVGGDTTLEAPSIKSVSGNVITLVSPITKSHSSGVIVRMSISGVNITGSIIEVGDFVVDNSNNINVTGNYFEGARPVISGYPRKLNISNNVIAETDAFINLVNRLSEIRYRDNEQNFPLRVAVANRSGSVDSYFDLYNMPLLDAGGLTRKQGSITINETVTETTAMAGNGIYLQDVKVSDTYDRMLSDRAMRAMKFEGLYAYAAPAGSFTALSMYNLIPTGAAYNGYTFDITARMRRETSLIPGIAKVIATAYNQNGTAGAANKTVSYLYGDIWNDTTGVRIQAVATTSRANLVCYGEPTGGQNTRFSLSGTVACML